MRVNIGPLIRIYTVQSARHKIIVLVSMVKAATHLIKDEVKCGCSNNFCH